MAEDDQPSHPWRAWETASDRAQAKWHLAQIRRTLEQARRPEPVKMDRVPITPIVAYNDEEIAENA